MAHFCLVSPPLRGHLDPMAALGRGLVRRGHRVTICTDFDAPAFDSTGLDVRGFAPDAGQGALARSPGAFAAIGAMRQRFDRLCDWLPGVFQDLGADAVVADQVEPAGALSAIRLGLPYASLAAALPLNREPGLPPPYVGWRFRADGSRRWLYEGGHRVTDLLMRPLSRAIGRRATAWGIEGVASLDDTFSPRLQLLQLVSGLDFPRRALPSAMHFVGPLRDPQAGRFDPGADGRPLGFCSLGSLQGFRADLFEAFAAALSAEGIRPVIAHGGRLSEAAAASLPGDPIVADFLPQRAVLPHCRLAIVHGGMNTVLDALAAGVPLIVAPIAYEQGAVAARVEASGAGLVLKPWRFRKALGAACRRLLTEPPFAEQARRLAVEIAAAVGVAAAAALLETMVEEGERGTPVRPRASGC